MKVKTNEVTKELTDEDLLKLMQAMQGINNPLGKTYIARSTDSSAGCALVLGVIIGMGLCAMATLALMYFR